MNRIIAVTIALSAFSLTTACAHVGPGLTGNDTGGIIPWSPYNQQVAPEWAAAHCAYYGKRARITHVWRRYGQYIAFACYWR